MGARYFQRLLWKKDLNRLKLLLKNESAGRKFSNYKFMQLYFPITIFDRKLYQKTFWNLLRIPCRKSKAGLTLNDLYDTTCMIHLVWLCKIASSYKLDVQICMTQLLKNRMSSISSKLYEGNRPITFNVSQCWIILKKNLV